ncbi:MAG TPA: tetratricopeptide repeat protein [Gammaproteobacteria bacterium]
MHARSLCVTLAARSAPGTLALLALAAALAGCAAAPEAPKPARIEIQEAVGFVITEQAGVGSDVRADYEQAVRLLEQGRTDEGIALLEQTAAAAPELTAPQIDLGIAWRRAGDLAKAEEHLKKALALNPGHPVAHNELGIVYRQLGHFAEARQSYEAALAIYPGFHYARRNLAVLCDLYLADFACALENYQAYVAAAPGDEEAEMWLADIRSRMHP